MYLSYPKFQKRAHHDSVICGGTAFWRMFTHRFVCREGLRWCPFLTLSITPRRLFAVDANRSCISSMSAITLRMLTVTTQAQSAFHQCLRATHVLRLKTEPVIRSLIYPPTHPHPNRRIALAFSPPRPPAWGK